MQSNWSNFCMLWVPPGHQLITDSIPVTSWSQRVHPGHQLITESIDIKTRWDIGCVLVRNGGHHFSEVNNPSHCAKAMGGREFLRLILRCLVAKKCWFFYANGLFGCWRLWDMCWNTLIYWNWVMAALHTPLCLHSEWYSAERKRTYRKNFTPNCVTFMLNYYSFVSSFNSPFS